MRLLIESAIEYAASHMAMHPYKSPPIFPIPWKSTRASAPRKSTRRGNSRRIRLPGSPHGAQREQYKTSFMPFRSCRPRLLLNAGTRLRRVCLRKGLAAEKGKAGWKVSYGPGIDVAAPERRGIPTSSWRSTSSSGAREGWTGGDGDDDDGDNDTTILSPV